MKHLLAKEVTKYECLVEASKRYPELDPDTALAFMYILKSGDECFRVVSRTFKERNLSHGKFMVLLHLKKQLDAEQTGLTPAEIADRALVTRATVSGLLDGLEKDGHIERRPDDRDRRKVMVVLTPEAIKLVDEVLPLHFKRVRDLMGCFDASENQALVTLLTKLNTYIDQKFSEDAD
jgi:DNA-binding MarR family transcriptional regulator